MDIEVSSEFPEPENDISPKYKITITDLSGDKLVFWYIDTEQNSEMDKKTSRSLSESLYETAIRMNTGSVESIEKNNKEYQLEKKGSHKFILKSMN